MIFAKHDTHFSNSMIEAFFRSLKNNFLYYAKPNTLTDLKSHVEFYVEQFNNVMPHSAHNGLTPYEKYAEKNIQPINNEMNSFAEQSKKIRYNSFWKPAA